MRPLLATKTTLPSFGHSSNGRIISHFRSDATSRVVAAALRLLKVPVENMNLIKIAVTHLLAAIALVTSACNNSNTSTTTTPSQTIATDVLTGTVQPPVNGVLQVSFGTFVVGQGGGSVAVTLTSAVETLAAGTFLTTVTMGVAIGTVTGGTCTPLANAFTIAQASSTAQLSGTLSPGTYCAQVSDVTSQLGPVAYALAVSHP